jgi:hypothetical protein
LTLAIDASCAEQTGIEKSTAVEVVHKEVDHVVTRCSDRGRGSCGQGLRKCRHSRGGARRCATTVLTGLGIDADVERSATVERVVEEVQRCY